MMLMKKGKCVGSKGSPLKNISGWGGAGGRVQRLPPQCVPRKKYIGTSGTDEENLGGTDECSSHEKHGHRRCIIETADTA